MIIIKLIYNAFNVLLSRANYGLVRSYHAYYKWLPKRINLVCLRYHRRCDVYLKVVDL